MFFVPSKNPFSAVFSILSQNSASLTKLSLLAVQHTAPYTVALYFRYSNLRQKIQLKLILGDRVMEKIGKCLFLNDIIVRYLHQFDLCPNATVSHPILLVLGISDCNRRFPINQVDVLNQVHFCFMPALPTFLFP